MADDRIVELKSLSKEFSGTRALDDVTLHFVRGEVHGLLGENGAGKSTLIKILTGVYGASGGEILLEGETVRFASPLDAHKAGLGAVYQDAEIVGSFTVGQNVVLGNEPAKLWLLSRAAIHAEAAEIMAEIGIDIDVYRPAATLSAAETQLVTLATLFHRKYKLIVLDEPTARLSAKETDLLFDIIHRFQRQGITIVYISHRLGEVRRICDRITILRGGRVSATLSRGEISEERVTELMVDRSRSDLETYNPGLSTDATVLEVRDLATDKLHPVSFRVRSGEVLGITGPVGGGMEEVARALGGVTAHEGSVAIDGRAVTVPTPTASRLAGIALIPEDRRKQALFPEKSLTENIVLPVLGWVTRFGLVRPGLADTYADGVIERLNVQPRKPHMQIRFFSGGNQQKAVIGKWLEAKGRVFVFVEPTAGVDVGAIKEIYDIILQMAHAGAAVIVVSSAAKEILSLAETVMVIHDGEIVHVGPKAECTHDQLLALAMSGRPKEAAE